MSAISQFFGGGGAKVRGVWDANKKPATLVQSESGFTKLIPRHFNLNAGYSQNGDSFPHPFSAGYIGGLYLLPNSYLPSAAYATRPTLTSAGTVRNYTPTSTTLNGLIFATHSGSLYACQLPNSNPGVSVTTDGITWTLRTTGTTQPYIRLFKSAGSYLFQGSYTASSVLYYSTDATSWSSRTFPQAIVYNDVMYDSTSGYYYFATNFGLYRTPNIATTQPTLVSINTECLAVFKLGNRILGLYRGYNEHPHYFIYSDDGGTTWVEGPDIVPTLNTETDKEQSPESGYAKSNRFVIESSLDSSHPSYYPIHESYAIKDGKVYILGHMSEKFYDFGDGTLTGLIIRKIVASTSDGVNFDYMFCGDEYAIRLATDRPRPITGIYNLNGNLVVTGAPKHIMVANPNAKEIVIEH